MTNYDVIGEKSNYHLSTCTKLTIWGYFPGRGEKGTWGSGTQTLTCSPSTNPSLNSTIPKEHSYNLFVTLPLIVFCHLIIGLPSGHPWPVGPNCVLWVQGNLSSRLTAHHRNQTHSTTSKVQVSSSQYPNSNSLQERKMKSNIQD